MEALDEVIKSDCENAERFNMFMVSDGSRSERVKIIDKCSGDDMALRVILSAIDFEWTFRRAVLALGYSPTAQIRAAFGKYDVHTPRGMKKIWRDQVIKCDKGRITLPAYFNSLDRFAEMDKSNWDLLQKAHNVRNRIVHGIDCSIGEKSGRLYSDVFLKASDSLIELVSANNGNVYGRIVRRVPRKRA